MLATLAMLLHRVHLVLLVTLASLAHLETKGKLVCLAHLGLKESKDHPYVAAVASTIWPRNDSFVIHIWVGPWGRGQC